MGDSVSNYPTSLDTSTEFPDIKPGTPQLGIGGGNYAHSTQHNSLAAAVLALEAAVGITGGFNALRGFTKVVAGANASALVKANADYVCDGTADDVQLQLAADSLTANRTWCETIKLIGDFQTTTHTEISPYTIVDATEAYLEVADSPGSGTIFRNANRAAPSFDEHIHFVGGQYNGRYAGGTATEPITLIRISRWSIRDVEIYGSSGNGITIEGVESGGGGTGENAERGREGVIDNLFTHDNAGIGLYVRRAARDIFIDRVTATSNTEHGVMIDASECTIGTIRCNMNGERGFYFTNGHSCAFNNIMAVRNGEHGVFFRGYVASSGNTIVSRGNGQATSNTYDEVHFDHTNGTHGPTEHCVIGQIVTETTDNLDGSPVGLHANLNQPWLKWTESPTQSGEYYLTRIDGTAPGTFPEPNNVYENPTADYAAGVLAAGTVGSLAVSEWDWADNDTLGFSTIYVRLSDTTDPSTDVMIARGYDWPQQARYSLYFTESNDGDPNSEGGTTTGNTDKIIVNGAWLATGSTGMIREQPNQGLRGINVNVQGASDNTPHYYKKETSGTATITSGNTSVTVTHGLDRAPTIDEISMNLSGSPTNNIGHWYVDTITSTQFNINTRNDPSTSGAAFGWNAKLRD